ncbi:hypothetical protein HMC16_08650 [Corynebacterium sp. zg-915]|uniref:Uncharacterized protein n=1 Tax=Corynebacterium wankanglinii TaxID=2735136 RepID=A0A838CL11_9CORY|nr:hypothetical protein [Corynebacterium wankanglinii]
MTDSPTRVPPQNEVLGTGEIDAPAIDRDPANRHKLGTFGLESRGFNIHGEQCAVDKLALLRRGKP